MDRNGLQQPKLAVHVYHRRIAAARSVAPGATNKREPPMSILDSNGVLSAEPSADSPSHTAHTQNSARAEVVPGTRCRESGHGDHARLQPAPPCLQYRG